jgi:hypothetical protein
VQGNDKILKRKEVQMHVASPLFRGAKKGSLFAVQKEDGNVSSNFEKKNLRMPGLSDFFGGAF